MTSWPLATLYGRYGYRRITAMLRRGGWDVNHKRVERIWRREGLKVPARQPRRGRLWLNDGSCVRLRPQGRNDVWAYDFVQVRTRDGPAVRLLTIIDENTRECLAIRAGRSIRSSEVIETLAELLASRGVPAHIRSDNGPEFTARAVRGWLAGGSEGQNPVHRAWVALGERIRGELQREAEGRTAGSGGVPHFAGGAGADRAVPSDLQRGQAPQFSGLPATSTRDHAVRRRGSSSGRTNIESGTTIGAGHPGPPSRCTPPTQRFVIQCRMAHQTRLELSSFGELKGHHQFKQGTAYSPLARIHRSDAVLALEQGVRGTGMRRSGFGPSIWGSTPVGGRIIR